MDTKQEKIQIYVACLASYTSGILHGVWIDATQDAHDIWAAISRMLRASPVPHSDEWAIHCYDGFEGLYLSASEGLDSVAEKAAFIMEHGKLGAEIATYYGGDIGDAKRALSEHYAGQFESVSEFARSLTEDTMDVPDQLAFYIDYEKMGRDLANGDVIAIELGFEECHIFWSH